MPHMTFLCMHNNKSMYVCKLKFLIYFIEICCVHSHKFNRNLSWLSSSYRVEEDNTYTTVKLILLEYRIGLQRADI